MSKSGVAKILVLAAAIVIISVTVKAKNKYMKLYDADSSSKAELHRKCSICHIDEDDPAKLTEFSKAFAKADYEISPELRKQFPEMFILEVREQMKTQSETDSQSEKAKEPVQREKSEKDSLSKKPAAGNEVVIEHEGKRLVVNTKDMTVRELPHRPAEEVAVLSTPENAVVANTTGKKGEDAPQSDGKKKLSEKIFRPTDVRLVNLPTAIPIPKGSLWNDYTHRWPNGDSTDATTLYGLDTRAVPSFGFTYGITDRLHVGAFRSSSDLARPIMIFAGSNLFQEQKGHPVSLMARIGLEGQDNFKRNFATSLEITVARSITKYAQVYVVPTVTFGDRPYNNDPTLNLEGQTAAAMGLGTAFKIRPTVVLMAEANYRFNKESRYQTDFSGIRRPVFGFGIQKIGASRRHTYSLTFSNGPGTTFAQRSMTRGIQGSDDALRGLSIGFNLTRRIF